VRPFWRQMGQSILAAVLEMNEVHTMARSLGIEVFLLEIRQAADIPPRFAALKGQAEAMYVCTDPRVSTHRIRINTLAAVARLPTMHSVREYVEAGGLMSYGANYPDLFRRAAGIVKILRGARPKHMGGKRSTARLAARATESGSKARRLCY
jgi:putative tryptophan/tyrosine transport system substrate-binding protein